MYLVEVVWKRVLLYLVEVVWERVLLPPPVDNIRSIPQ